MGGGKIKGKCAAKISFTCQVDISGKIFHNAVDHGKAQSAAAAAHNFSRVKRLKNMLPILRPDSDSGVLNFNDDVFSSRDEFHA